MKRVVKIVDEKLPSIFSDHTPEATLLYPNCQIILKKRVSLFGKHFWVKKSYPFRGYHFKNRKLERLFNKYDVISFETDFDINQYHPAYGKYTESGDLINKEKAEDFILV